VSEKASIGDRARDVAAQAIPQARRAGNTAAHGVMQGVQGARGWAAPRLEDAADAITATVAPKVSSALRSTARQVQPEQAGKTGIRRLLSWRWLFGIGAAIAAAGAAAAITMRRYQSATADAKDSADTLADGTADASAGTDEAASQSGVNGRVTSGR
jgi:hypothetical protein